MNILSINATGEIGNSQTKNVTPEPLTYTIYKNLFEMGHRAKCES